MAVDLRAAALLASMLPAAAGDVTGYWTGNTLWEKCQAPGPEARCYAYVTGAVDGFLALQAQGHVPRIVCLPSESTVGQITDVAVKYLANHPEYRHTGAASLVASAMYEAFPCKPGQ